MKNKIKSDLRNWEKRYLTPLGKITVLKTLILPKLNQVFVSLPNPDSFIMQEIISICYKFIWEGKPDKINCNQLCLSYLDGGLRMININCFIKALKMSWIRQIYIKLEAPWSQLATHIIGQLDKIVFLGSEWSLQTTQNTSNNFWKDVLLAWSDTLLILISSASYQSKMCVPLWSNPEFVLPDLDISRMYKNGVLCPPDLVNNNCHIMSWDELARYYHSSLDFLSYHRLYLCLKKYIQT